MGALKGNRTGTQPQAVEVGSVGEKEYIKWVDFNVSYEALCEAYKWDVETYEEAQADKNIAHVNWIQLLAYVGAKHGGDFPSGTVSEIAKTAKKVKTNEITMSELVRDMKYYAYYLEAYEAVLGGFVGEYEIQKKREDGKAEWEKCYGLKAFSPIAKGFEYSDYDDFGASRSYGYSRPHLGHDMMGQVGTPVVAIESGYVEAIGWNQYGGWHPQFRWEKVLLLCPFTAEFPILQRFGRGKRSDGRAGHRLYGAYRLQQNGKCEQHKSSPSPLGIAAYF